MSKNPTPNHDLPRPTPGSFAGTWGKDIMNDDLTQKLEERLPVRDSKGVVDTYEPYSDAVYVSDEGDVYVADGDSWDHLGRLAAREDVAVASNHGYPGDGSGGDIATFILDNRDKRILLDGDTYRLESSLSELASSDPGTSTVEIIGIPEATIEVHTKDVDVAFPIGHETGTIDDIEIKNVAVDISASSDYDAGLAHLHASQSIDNANLELVGRRNHQAGGDSTIRGNKFSYFSCMVDEDGVGFHRNIRLPDGDTWSGDDNNSHAIGFSADPPHVGIQYWEGCFVAEHWDNGYYLKNSPGTNVTIGCTAKNNGRNNIRLGRNDIAIGSRSVWDLPEDDPNYPIGQDGGASGFGVLLDMDAARGTSVVGFEGIRHTGNTAGIRLRTAAESATVSDAYIRNTTSEYSVRLTSDSDHPDNKADARPDEAVLSVDGLYISEESGTSTRGAAVRVARPHAHLNDVTYLNEGGSSDRSFIEVSSDAGARVTNSHIKPHPDGFTVRQATTGGRLEFEGCVLESGIAIYDSQGGMIDKLRIESSDLSAVSDLFPYEGPEEGLVGEFAFGSTNFGWSGVEYGRHAGNEFVAETMWAQEGGANGFRLEDDETGAGARFTLRNDYTTIYNLDGGGWYFRYIDPETGTSTPFRFDANGNAGFDGYLNLDGEIMAPSGSIGGDSIATEPWVDSNYTTPDEARAEVGTTYESFRVSNGGSVGWYHIAAGEIGTTSDLADLNVNMVIRENQARASTQITTSTFSFNGRYDSWSAGHYHYGNYNDIRAHMVATVEDHGTDGSQYHVYLRADSYITSDIEVWFSGGKEYVGTDVAESDVRGTVLYDSSNNDPDNSFSIGDIDAYGTIRQGGNPVATEQWVGNNTVQTTSAWDGNSLTLETGDGDTIEFISE